MPPQAAALQRRLPGWRLPLRTACHRDTLGVGGSLRKRWTVTREFSDCKLFNVETNEEIERIGEP